MQSGFVPSRLRVKFPPLFAPCPDEIGVCAFGPWRLTVEFPDRWLPGVPERSQIYKFAGCAEEQILRKTLQRNS